MAATPVRSAYVHLSLLAVSLIYGANYTIAKNVMEAGLDSSAFILVRVACGAAFFTIYHRLFVRESVRSRPDHFALAVAGFFGVAANMLLFFKGLSITDEVNASVLMLNTPVFVLVFSAIFFRRKVMKRHVAGIFIAATGALLLIGGWNFRFSNITVYGDILIVMNAMSYAFYLVYVRKLLVAYSALTVARWVFTYGLIFVLPFGVLPLAEAPFAEFETGIWLSILFVVLATTIVAYFFNAWSVQKASPTLVAGYIYLQPVFATAIAIISRKQALLPEKILFAALIFTGVYLVSRKPRRKS